MYHGAKVFLCYNFLGAICGRIRLDGMDGSLVEVKSTFKVNMMVNTYCGLPH